MRNSGLAGPSPLGDVAPAGDGGVGSHAVSVPVCRVASRCFPVDVAHATPCGAVHEGREQAPSRKGARTVPAGGWVTVALGGG